MKTISRRQLANYAVDEMQKGTSFQTIANQLSSELIDSGRKDEFELLIKDIYQTLETRGVTTTVQVTTINKLSESSKKLIEEFTSKLTKTEHVKVEEQIDLSLIAGMRLQTANLTWDNSAKSQLNKLSIRSKNE